MRFINPNMTDLKHIPVLLTETLDLLNLKANTNVIDGTLGLGGHTLEILKKLGPKGRVMAFEQDERNLKIAQERLKKYQKQVIFVHDNFENLERQVKKHKFKPQAILLDLGLSSPHVEDAERGFSFMKEGPLDMRFDKRQTLTAAQVVNSFSEKELADIIYEYGEERQSRKIARRIVEARKKKRIETTVELAEIIAGNYKRSVVSGQWSAKSQKSELHAGRWSLHTKKIHPATLTFQALRIYVNRELEVLEKVLKAALDLLPKHGRLVVISYHALEDRIVKNFFRDQTKNCICPKELPICQCNFKKKLYILTRKPIIPSGVEVSANPRSRSAKLRAAERL